MIPDSFEKTVDAKVVMNFDTLDGITLWPAPSVGFLAALKSYMAVLGVPSGPIGFVAALGFKILDSQPEKSNMSPVWIGISPDFLNVLGFSECPWIFWIFGFSDFLEVRFPEIRTSGNPKIRIFSLPDFRVSGNLDCPVVGCKVG